MNIHHLWRLIHRFTRPRRMAKFCRYFDLDSSTQILDVGGTPPNWGYIQARPRVTMLNLQPPKLASEPQENLELMIGDVLCPPSCVSDQEWDIVFSNSVIEHVGDWEAQRRFAEACRSLGRGVWVQTPARSFFIEPHYLTPFVHWLPRRWRARLLPFTLWGLITRPSRKRMAEMLDEIRLLSYREMRDLFPDCQIVVERFFFWPKSYIAVRK